MDFALFFNKLFCIIDSPRCESNDVTSTINYPKKVDVDSCVLSTVPRPLPLSCPGQHLHTWRTRDLDHVGVDDIGRQGHGHLKVILAEGVIYRLASYRKQINIYNALSASKSRLVFAKLVYIYCELNT